MTETANGEQTQMSPNGLLDDVLFKIVFGNQKRSRIFRALLNALLGYTGDQKIMELTIVGPELEKIHLSDKGAILDLRAIDGSGQQYNVEVQLSPGNRTHFIQRTVHYLTKLHCEQIGRGEDYASMAKSICISILDFVLFKEIDQLHTTFHLKETQKDFALTDLIELHCIELPKFSADMPHRLRNPFEKWLHTLKCSNLYAIGDEPLPDNLKEEEGISMAIDALRDAYADEEVRELIRIREKARRDYISGMKDATDQGRLESLVVFLKARFGDVTSVSATLEKLPGERVEALLPLAATAATLEEFAVHLAS